jgi:hypothetical protein
VLKGVVAVVRANWGGVFDGDAGEAGGVVVVINIGGVTVDGAVELEVGSVVLLAGAKLSQAVTRLFPSTDA